MESQPRVSLFQMLSTLSSALDLVSPAVVNHQKKVAYIAGGLAREMGLPAGEVAAILLAGFLHDCGALSLQSKLDALRFDFDLADPHHHSEVGARFLAKLENSFADVASLGLSTLVRFHHVSWEHGRGESFRGQPVPLAAHLLHLADRVAVLVRPEREILGQSADIMDQVSAQAGRLFLPVQVQALKELASREHFWLALVFDDFLDRVLAEAASEAPAVLLDVEGLMRLAQVFAQVVDFRSRFTATHSSGVADVARALASLAGFSAREKEMMAIAGYLHDLGKLAVPKEILEKPGPLTMEEYNLVKAHPFHAYRLLSPLAPLDMVVPWACFHHEELGGLGYPFRHQAPDLPLGARIIAVADRFTAMTEDRPYRLGLPADHVLAILQRCVDEGRLDPLAVSLLERHCGDINDARMMAQAGGMADYWSIERAD